MRQREGEKFLFTLSHLIRLKNEMKVNAFSLRLHLSLDEEKNGYVARDQLLYALLWRAGPMPGVTDLASARSHVGTRTNQGYRIDYVTEKPDLHHQLGMRRAPILVY